MPTDTLTHPSLAEPLVVARGREPYEVAYAAMRAFTEARTAATPDELWIVEHPPVFTLGLGADRSHVLAPGDIPVVQTDRGGEVTYHGPGQAVIYLLLDLRRRQGQGRLYAREFVRRIEQAVIDTLDAYNLKGQRQPGAPGIYLAAGPWKGAKIAALGLKVKASGCTYHGVALNVDVDLEAFSRIHPCGYEGLVTVDLRTLGVNASLAAVQHLLTRTLIDRLKG